MKQIFLLLVLFPLVASVQSDKLRLSLDDCIAITRRQSIDAAVALGELRSAYWQWRSYRADLLPEVSLSGSSGSGNHFMSLPVTVTLSQPLFSVNHLKWNCRIEPLRYREAQARFLTETEQVAMQAISLNFSLLLAG